MKAWKGNEIRNSEPQGLQTEQSGQGLKPVGEETFISSPVGVDWTPISKVGGGDQNGPERGKNNAHAVRVNQ